ncbi:histidine--tRNA ligase [Candidatus Haliotispira prima]|uniref:Histidine--tRNA ligase n=1 Tax=Candidatus Haliotispira prima TaxID=3034016 RepID=A0ABY8MGJ6_9SPIO|nr:histidine--tRNA ligase [Candidatus Haliotispira prima]
MAKLIQPRVLKGFRDSLPYGPQGEKRRRRMISKLGDLFELGGFDPIDTPALELAEILLGKAGGETEKQVYRFQDNGGRDVALRFDLTVPFSRFVVQHAGDLDFPFKRYHIAKVWRGENAQRGRYREFFQCDFDIVGDGSILADLCILQMVHNALRALQQDYPALGPMRIHVNHRGLLAAFWNVCGVEPERRSPALRIIDKLHKIGCEAARRELEALLGPKITEALLACLGLSSEETGQDRSALVKLSESPDEPERLRVLLQELAGGELPVEAQNALAELRQIAAFAKESSLNLYFDPSIARGLDYYTGMVFETFPENLPDLGSVCSGGRYDKLTQMYSKAEIPGVGGSIGLDRLLAGLEELEQSHAPDKAATPDSDESSLIISLDPDWKTANIDGEKEDQARLACIQLSRELQQNHLSCDVVPLVKKMNALFQRAENRNCRYLLLLKPDFRWQLRNLQNRESKLLQSAVEILQTIRPESGP